MTSNPRLSPGHIGSSRYAVPALPADNLRRQRLLDFLHANTHRKLNLVCAAAGYGKSSLLINFAHDTDYPLAWCRLVESDSDPAMLATSLTAALQVVFPAVEFDLPQVAAQPGITPDELANAWIHELEASITDYFVLVLDDFHLIQNSPAIIRFFDVLLAALPDQVHLFIAGRVIPPLRIAALAARQEIAGLSEEHLRFTPVEVQQLLEVRNGLPLPEGEAEKLIAGTEGWITGILLTTHLMWQALMANLIRARQSESPLYDYLAGEVFNLQPAGLRRFLMESAVLPEMEPAQCDAVLGCSDSAQQLQQAEAQRLFITVVGDESPVYQYHHLFRDFLIARLREQDPERLRALQQRAGEWYAASHMPEAAVTFYVLAGQMLLAAQVAEANAQSMFMAGRRTTLERWAQQSAPIAHEVPSLHQYLTTMEIDAGHLDKAEQTMAIASAGFERQDKREGHLYIEIQRTLLLYRRGAYDRALAQAHHTIELAQTLQRPSSAAVGLRYVGLCHLALGQLDLAGQSLQEAVQLLEGSPHLYDLASTLTDQAMVLYAQGQTARATQSQQRALALWRERSTPGPLALALNNIGWNMHMLGQYQSALTVYDEALDWARRAGSLRWEATIQVGRADVLADLRDDAAAELYQQAGAGAEQINDQGLLSYAYRGLARLDRLHQNYLGAQEWLRRAREVSPRFSPFGNLDALHGLILIDLERVAEGRAILNAACAELERSGMLIGLAQALLFRAYAEFRSNEPETAAQSLAQAFATADRVGHDQMLISEALGVRAMLDALITRPNIGVRVGVLLARAQAVLALKPHNLVTIDHPQHAAFQVFALGAGRVLKEGADIPRTDWISQRTRELFFFLIDRLPIARDDILKTFWPDKPLARAVANFYQTLYRLRRVVGGEMVILEDQICRLAPGFNFEYDVARLEEQAQLALQATPQAVQRVGQLASAAALCTGEYLSDLATDWTLARREVLNEMQVNVLREYAAQLMHLTRYMEARDTLSRALAIEPFDDSLHSQMLTCLASLGRRHEVVDYYRRYRDTLRAELGLDPPVEIRALYSRLIN